MLRAEAGVGGGRGRHRLDGRGIVAGVELRERQRVARRREERRQARRRAEEAGALERRRRRGHVRRPRGSAPRIAIARIARAPARRRRLRSSAASDCARLNAIAALRGSRPAARRQARAASSRFRIERMRQRERDVDAGAIGADARRLGEGAHGIGRPVAIEIGGAEHDGGVGGAQVRPRRRFERLDGTVPARQRVAHPRDLRARRSRVVTGRAGLAHREDAGPPRRTRA